MEEGGGGVKRVSEMGVERVSEMGVERVSEMGVESVSEMGVESVSETGEKIVLKTGNILAILDTLSIQSVAPEQGIFFGQNRNNFCTNLGVKCLWTSSFTGCSALHLSVLNLPGDADGRQRYGPGTREQGPGNLLGLFPSKFAGFSERKIRSNPGKFRSFWPYDITIGQGTRFMDVSVTNANLKDAAVQLTVVSWCSGHLQNFICYEFML